MGHQETSSEPIPRESMVDKGFGTFYDEFMDLNGGSVDFKATLLRKSHTEHSEEDMSDDDVDLDEFEINDADFPDDSSISILRLSKHERKKLWKPWGDMKVVDVGNGYYLVKLPSWEDKAQVLSEGPWVIASHYLSVQSWTLEFDPLADKIRHMALWTTEMANRGRFARICVEMDVFKPLIPKLIVGGLIQHVEYEGVGTICFHCGCIGHRDTNCDKMDKNVEAMNVNSNQRTDGILAKTTTENVFKVLDSLGNMEEEQDMVSQDLPRSEEAPEKMDASMIAKQDNIASSSKSGSSMALADVSNLQVQRTPFNVATAIKGKSQGHKGPHSQGLSFNKSILNFKRKRDRKQIELSKAGIHESFEENFIDGFKENMESIALDLKNKV
ncbi:hypothetical protein FEM48_Zijuj03G0167000 [Ziziphus jujuba var. spinosa]|uniref:DUF4283 domain-containing protein n=1 Tax=Ziziphus jujuba var. spinosa TaxID=714518 RepID=A0A978VRG1_ZIZJJ|nr:hypothetical protein FEM48_Zijuj03G0167000 [Ziziphus jujuba var. spinosa]